MLAWNNPSSTYHFAPFIVAGAWPWFARSSLGPVPVRGALPSVVGGAALSLIAGLVLLGADKLQGPTFWSEAGQPSQVVLEIAIATVLGSGLGLFSRVQGASVETPVSSRDAS